jgi:hypothetical protein
MRFVAACRQDLHNVPAAVCAGPDFMAGWLLLAAGLSGKALCCMLDWQCLQPGGSSQSDSVNNKGLHMGGDPVCTKRLACVGISSVHPFHFPCHALRDLARCWRDMGWLRHHAFLFGALLFMCSQNLYEFCSGTRVCEPSSLLVVLSVHNIR